MNPQTVALDDLAQRISELETLKREYQARQARLPALQRRERRLEKQLQKVRGQIEALTKGSGSRAAAVPQPAAKGKQAAAKSPATKVATPKASAPKLADLLVEIVGAAGGPIKVQAIAEEVKRRKFPTTSKDIRNLVSTVVTKLVGGKVLRRTAGRKGIVLRKSKAESQPVSAKKSHAAPGQIQNGAVSAKPSATANATKNGHQSLQSVLTAILAKSRRPLSAQELADQARAAGYESKSKDFRNVVWTTLGKMNAVNVPGKGFQLKG